MNAVSPRFRRVFLTLSSAVVLVLSWNLICEGNIQLFFNKVYVAFDDDSEPERRCQVQLDDTQSVGFVNAWALRPADLNNPGSPARIEFGTYEAYLAELSAAVPPDKRYPGSCLTLCAELGYGNATGTNIPIDSMRFEIFKYLPGSNPLDPSSSPPVRTFTFSNVGEIAGKNGGLVDGVLVNIEYVGGTLGPKCVGWNGSYNLMGEFGKTNGEFGFRAYAKTDVQNDQVGNISIETSPPAVYPGHEEGFDVNVNPVTAQQEPIRIDVVDVHIVMSSPTLVGAAPAVAAQPYNFSYRLSKDATMYINVWKCGGGPDPCASKSLVRDLVNGLPRQGEGYYGENTMMGDFWDGRDQYGNIFPYGVYLADFCAEAGDNYGLDSTCLIAETKVTRQMGFDPLQITDIRVTPLLNLSTSWAVLGYTLTEDATAYLDIYEPGTYLSRVPSIPWPEGNGAMTNFNDISDISGFCGAVGEDEAILSECLQPTVMTAGGPVPAGRIRSFREEKRFRRSVYTKWDGRDEAGSVMDDGDYFFALYAGLPSGAGHTYMNEGAVWTSKIYTGHLSVIRGLPGISQISPGFAVIGASPAVGGLDPFSFKYSLSRDSIVTFKIYGTTTTPPALVRTLVDRNVRESAIVKTEKWDGIRSNGEYLPAGVYLAELQAEDPFFPSKVSTTTVLFPIDLFRITNVSASPLLGGATENATLSYLLSQTMRVRWAVYPPGTRILNRETVWPPTPGNIIDLAGNPVSPVRVIEGVRPGRLSVTEYWDGRDEEGFVVADGQYVFVLFAETETTPKFFTMTDKIAGTISVARGPIVFTHFEVTPTIPRMFNSSETVWLPPFQIDYILTRQSSVTVQVLTAVGSPMVVANVVQGGVRDPNMMHTEIWEGRDDNGNWVESAWYNVRLTAQDLLTRLAERATVQQTISVENLRVYDVAIAPVTLQDPYAIVSYQVSESMKVAVKIYKPGTTFDDNGNPSPPEIESLVRVLVGVKPGRTLIDDYWDGRDYRLALVPDGNYLFKIVASTDLAAIDSFTGNVAPGGSIVPDIIVAELPVVRGASLDPEGDFVRNTFVYPNPVRGSVATFHIHVPLPAQVTMKIYNLAGDLIKTFDLEQQATGGGPIDPKPVWNLNNEAGRRVAHGVYFAVIREEGVLGDKTVFQTVKKILIP